jgi:hypothetical protein
MRSSTRPIPFPCLECDRDDSAERLFCTLCLFRLEMRPSLHPERHSEFLLAIGWTCSRLAVVRVKGTHGRRLHTRVGSLL